MELQQKIVELETGIKQQELKIISQQQQLQQQVQQINLQQQQHVDIQQQSQEQFSLGMSSRDIMEQFRRIKPLDRNHNPRSFVRSVESTFALCVGNEQLARYGLEILINEKILGEAGRCIRELDYGASWPEVKQKLMLQCQPKKTYAEKYKYCTKASIMVMLLMSLIQLNQTTLQISPINENNGFVQIKTGEVDIDNTTCTLIHMINIRDVENILHNISMNIKSLDLHSKGILQNEIDLIKSKLKTILPQILFGEVYLPCGNISAFEELIGDLVVKYDNVIISGDFNNNLFCTSKSYLMLSMCNRLHLTYAHNSLPTHFDTRTSSTSLLDFFLLSPSLDVRTSNQMLCPGISNHAFIFATFNLPNLVCDDMVEYRNYSAIDMMRMDEEASLSDYNQVFGSNDVDVQLSGFMSNVFALHDLVPVTRRGMLQMLS
ncbi:uncharacterized protein LOC135956608 [Calliphora vicina]|uniref:uncharacterized protein LOC135956608 n=1 Tax=Calliphora vicina TaxID=7373 RepID=UPI00325A6F04